MMRPSFGRLLLLLAGLGLLPHSSQAQSAEYSCPHFNHLHQAVDCLEAIFSEDSKPLLYTHLALGSVPPGNGFALGLITEKPIHYVSAFAPRISPDMRDRNIFVVPSYVSDPGKPDSGGLKSLFVPRIGEAVSQNGSWYVTGGFDWMPGVYASGSTLMPPLRPGLPRVKHPCHQWGKLCTDSVLTLHADGSYSVARTIDFYGLGPASPNTQYTFRLDQTWGSLQGRLPLLDYHTASTSNELAGAAGIEVRHLQLPVESLPASVFTNFKPATLPGLAAVPTYLHTNVGISDSLTHVSEQKLKPNQTPPLLKRYDAVTLHSNLAYHWYTDTGSASASFQQVVAHVDLGVELGARIQKHIISASTMPFWQDLYYRFLSARCGGSPADPRVDVDPKADAIARKTAKEQAAAYLKENGYRYELKNTDFCDFGNISITTHLAASHSSPGNAIPCFMRPTVGGQDIDSLTSLRGFGNYRFRGSDATFIQTSYTLPVYDPLGILVFYDAGNAGDSLGALSFAHLRQDAGLGVNIRIMRVSRAQAYLAWGAGSGAYLGYNLVKQF